MLQGQKRPAHRRPADPLRAGAGGRRAAGRVLRARRRRRTSRSCTLLASYAYGRPADARQARSTLGEGLVGQCALEKREDPAHQRAARLLPHRLRPAARRRRSTSWCCRSSSKAQVQGVLELASFERFNPTHQAFLDQLTESIGIVLNTIEANMRTEDLLKQSQSLAAGAAEPAAGAAADQRGAAGEGAPAGAPEPGGRAQEPGGRAGPPGAGGEGQAARAHLEVQVRVPRQHVARAAHAAQQPADPVRPAVARTPTAT